MANIKDHIMTLVAEFFGTFMLAIMFMSFQTQAFSFVLAFTGIYAFGAKASGAMYNPAITLGYFLNQNTNIKLDRPLALFYVLAQYAGGVAGAIVGVILHKGKAFGGWQWNATGSVVVEILGGFILMIFYFSQTCSETKFSKSPALRTMMIGVGYVFVATISFSPCNPALALGYLISYIFANEGEGTGKVWIGLWGAYIGAALGWLFFEYWYRKAPKKFESRCASD